MDPSQQESRQAAAEAFMESLDQLEQSLQAASEPLSAGDRSSQLAQSLHGERIEVEALEAAAADIEQFMQTKYSEPGEQP